MSQRMAAAGADAVMVVTPSYYKGGMKVRLCRRELLVELPI